MAKASKLQMAERKTIILKLIGQGRSRSEISKELAPKYGVSEQSIERQYDKAINELTELHTDNMEDIRTEYLLQLRDLYRKAYNDESWKIASEIIEKQAKLMGMYKDKQEDKKQAPTIHIIERDDSLDKTGT